MWLMALKGEHGGNFFIRIEEMKGKHTMCISLKTLRIFRKERVNTIEVSIEATNNNNGFFGCVTIKLVSG